MPNSASERCWACVHLTHLDKLRAVALHGQGIAPAIHALKYGGDPSLAVELGQLMAQHWPFGAPPIDLIVVPVPLGRRRRWERGYNQAERVARQLALALNRPLAADVLVRNRHTRPQVGLGLVDRQANMVGAFAIGHGLALAGRTVLLVDDVCTTGSTLEACAATLKTTSVVQVWAYTLSRAVRADHSA